MRELNALTKKLFSEGYTKENYPEYIKGYDSFYGGFEYKYDIKQRMVFKTPCRLFAKYASILEGMSYGGIDWSIENEHAICFCPYHTRKETCNLNHEQLECLSAGCHYENMHYCILKQTDEPYDYENSVEKQDDIAEQIRIRKRDEFIQNRNGRVCEWELRYNHSTQQWSQQYNVHTCLRQGCEYCSLRDIELLSKKSNIVYDVEIVSIEKGFGLIPDSEIKHITRNNKFTSHPIYENLANCILKQCENEIDNLLQSRHHTAIFFGQIKSVKAINVRAERKLKHDIYEDLALIKEEFTVSYTDVIEKQQKIQKSEKRTAAKQKRIDSVLKRYIQNGYDGLEKYRYQFDKMIERGDIDIDEANSARAEFLKKQEEKCEQNQLSFFTE